MTQALKFWVEGCPVPKARARTVRAKTGKVVSFTPRRTSRWENVVRLVAQAACSKARWKASPGAYAVHLEVFRARRAGDADNFGKAVLDAIQGVCFPNDVQVTDLRVEVKDVGCNLGVMVVVSRLPKAAVG